MLGTLLQVVLLPAAGAEVDLTAMEAVALATYRACHVEHVHSNLGQTCTECQRYCREIDVTAMWEPKMAGALADAGRHAQQLIALAGPATARRAVQSTAAVFKSSAALLRAGTLMGNADLQAAHTEALAAVGTLTKARDGDVIGMAFTLVPIHDDLAPTVVIAAQEKQGLSSR